MNAKEAKSKLIAIAERLDNLGDSISGDTVADAAVLLWVRRKDEITQHKN